MSKFTFIAKFIAPTKVMAPVIIALMVVWLVISTALFLSSVRVTGKVVQQVQKGSGDDAYYCPVAVFRDATGIEHTIHSFGGSNPPRFPVGSTVSVLYSAKNPNAAMIEDHVMLWICPLLMIALGVFYGGVAIVADRWLRAKMKENAA